MDLFKLIYEHDIRLDELRGRHTDRNKQETSTSIEDFLTPDPTYSKFYITGTVPDSPAFGINTLAMYDEVMEAVSGALNNYNTFTEKDSEPQPFISAVEESEIGQPIILSKSESIDLDFNRFTIDSDSNVGHKKEAIATLLKTDDLLLYKEHAHDGFDLHLFSKKNIYRSFFYPFQKMVSDDFRFFSMNGKRITSERKFYFETWTLDRPPHGVEEVFKETVL